MSRHSKTDVNPGVTTAEVLTCSNDPNLLERKIILATEGFVTKFPQSTLRDLMKY